MRLEAVRWNDNPKSSKGPQYPLKLLMASNWHYKRSPKKVLASNPHLNTPGLKRRGTIRAPGATSWATAGGVEYDTDTTKF